MTKVPMSAKTSQMIHHFAAAHALSLSDAHLMLYAKPKYGPASGVSYWHGSKFLHNPVMGSDVDMKHVLVTWSDFLKKDPGLYLHPYCEASTPDGFCAYHKEKVAGGAYIGDDGYHIFLKSPSSSPDVLQAKGALYAGGSTFTLAGPSSHPLYGTVAEGQMQGLSPKGVSGPAPSNFHFPKWACAEDVKGMPSFTFLKVLSAYSYLHYKGKPLKFAWDHLKLGYLFPGGHSHDKYVPLSHYETYDWSPLKEVIALPSCEVLPGGGCSCLVPKAPPEPEGKKFLFEKNQQMVLQATEDGTQVIVPEGFKIVLI